MSWQEQNALRRVFNVFKRNKTNVYPEDINALKTLNESLEMYQKEFVNDNKLFAKLLSIQIMQNVRYFGNIETALKSLKDDLKNPIEYNLEFLKTELNQKAVNNYFESIGIIEDKTLKDKANNEDIILKNQKEIMDNILKSWS